jgi:hypothetical protein
MPWPLYPKGKGLQYPLNRRLGGAYSQYGDLVNKKYLLPCPEVKPYLALYITYPLYYDILAPQ